MNWLCQVLEVSFDIYNVESGSSEGRMIVDWGEGVLIIKRSYRDFDRMTAYRFHSYYVN